LRVEILEFFGVEGLRMEDVGEESVSFGECILSEEVDMGVEN
jgi:hypothetical protein